MRPVSIQKVILALLIECMLMCQFAKCSVPISFSQKAEISKMQDINQKKNEVENADEVSATLTIKKSFQIILKTKKNPIKNQTRFFS